MKECGAKQFIIHSIGSHGCRTVEGNIEVLHGYGISIKSMGVPIKATMDVVLVGDIEDWSQIYCRKHAA